MKLLIIDIDWIVGKTNRLRNFDIDWPRYPSIGLDYRLDWIGLASLRVTNSNTHRHIFYHSLVGKDSMSVQHNECNVLSVALFGSG